MNISEIPSDMLPYVDLGIALVALLLLRLIANAPGCSGNCEQGDKECDCRKENKS